MASSGIRHTVSSTPVSRSQYESEEHHAIVSGSSFPTSPAERQLFYRTDLHKLYIYNGTTWVDCTSQGTTVHNDLTNRDAADCHPLSAITGLSAHASRHQNGGADVINLAGLDGEPSTLTTHKSLATGIHGVGTNYIAQAPSSGHLVRSFTKGWTDGYYLKGAGVNQDPNQIMGNLSCKARKSITQSIPNITWTTVTLDTEDWDLANMHDNVTNNSRITAPADGVYLASAVLTFAPNSTGTRIIYFARNGSRVEGYQIPALSGGNYTSIFYANVYWLNALDYLEVQTYQDSGGSLNLPGANFSLTKLLI